MLVPAEAPGVGLVRHLDFALVVHALLGEGGGEGLGGNKGLEMGEDVGHFGCFEGLDVGLQVPFQLLVEHYAYQILFLIAQPLVVL